MNSNPFPPKKARVTSTKSCMLALTLFTLHGSIDALHAQSDQTWSNSAGSYAWSTTALNWTGAAWTNNNNAIFGTAGVGSIAASGIAVNDFTFNATGYEITGSLLLANDTASKVSNNVAVTIKATIADSSSGASILTKDGSGVLTLSGVNTYSYATIVLGGTLSVDTIANGGVASSIGASSSASFALQLKNGATLLYTGSGATTNRSMMIDFSGVIDASGTGALSFSGGALQTNTGTASTTSRTITLSGTNIGNNTMGSVISDPTGAGSPTTSLVKSGLGRWIISAGTNAYSGGTTVSAGTLLVNNMAGSGLGSGAVIVNGGAIGGVGSFTGGLTINAGATLQPGAGSIETLGSGALVMNNNSVFEYEVSSSASLSAGADLQRVSGGLTLNGTVVLSLSDIATTPSGFLQGTTFTLVNYTGEWNGGLFTVNGNAIADGGTFVVGANTWMIDYNASTGGSNFSGEYTSISNFTNIVVIPEPGTLALAFVGVFSPLFKLRRSRAIRLSERRIT